MDVLLAHPPENPSPSPGNIRNKPGIPDKMEKDEGNSGNWDSLEIIPVLVVWYKDIEGPLVAF